MRFGYVTDHYNIRDKRRWQGNNRDNRNRIRIDQDE